MHCNLLLLVTWMVCYFGFQTKRSNIGDACKHTHEGTILDLWCLMLGNNQSEAIVNNCELGEDNVDSLISLRDSFLVICRDIAFEPYNPNGFST